MNTELKQELKQLLDQYPFEDVLLGLDEAAVERHSKKWANRFLICKGLHPDVKLRVLPVGFNFETEEITFETYDYSFGRGLRVLSAMQKHWAGFKKRQTSR
jgi:hypothetical protein